MPTAGRNWRSKTARSLPIALEPGAGAGLVPKRGLASGRGGGYDREGVGSGSHAENRRGVGQAKGSKSTKGVSQVGPVAAVLFLPKVAVTHEAAERYSLIRYRMPGKKRHDNEGSGGETNCKLPDETALPHVLCSALVYMRASCSELTLGGNLLSGCFARWAS